MANVGDNTVRSNERIKISDMRTACEQLNGQDGRNEASNVISNEDNNVNNN